MSTSAPSRGPADDLGDVWAALDALPRAAAGPELTATTVELAAVELGHGTRRGSWLRPGGWSIPAAVVATALAAGIVAGRVRAPHPDQPILENYAAVRHLDLVREAGSIAFLEEFAAAGHAAPPAPRQDPEVAAAEARRFTARLEALAEDVALQRASATDPERLRTTLVDLPADAREELERHAEEFLGSSLAQRRNLAETARALADPRRSELRDAAAEWHRWVTRVRPEEQPAIIARSTAKRIEWLSWYAERLPDGRPGDRPRPPDRPERRGPPGGEGRPPRWPPRGGGPNGERGPGEWRPPGPPFRPGGPPPPPAETPAAPN